MNKRVQISIETRCNNCGEHYHFEPIWTLSQDEENYRELVEQWSWENEPECCDSDFVIENWTQEDVTKLGI